MRQTARSHLHQALDVASTLAILSHQFSHMHITAHQYRRRFVLQKQIVQSILGTRKLAPVFSHIAIGIPIGVYLQTLDYHMKRRLGSFQSLLEPVPLSLS
jgi:hypothetical protein